MMAKRSTLGSSSKWAIFTNFVAIFLLPLPFLPVTVCDGLKQFEKYVLYRHVTMIVIPPRLPL